MQNRSLTPIDDHREFSPDAPFEPYGEYFINVPDVEFRFMHRHNFLEIGYLKKGSGVFNIGNDIVSVKAPAVSIIYRDQLHSAQSSPNDPCEWCFLYIDIAYAMPHIDAKFLSGLRFFSYNEYDFKSVIEKNDDEMIFNLVKTIITEAAEKGRSHLKIIEGALLTLLTLHSKSMVRRKEDVRLDAEAFIKIEKAINYINANYNSNVRISELAKMCYISESSLRRLFKRFSGHSPESYLQRVRVNIAASRLLADKRKIIDIAYECGYSSVSSFNRQFAAFYKTSPSEWRKAHFRISK